VSFLAGIFLYMRQAKSKLISVYSDRSAAEFGANAGLVWNATKVKVSIDTS
jgi:hypothetical protein